jgi:hypothetical protein
VKLLYLCYWGIDEGLTQATVFPQLRMLAEMEHIHKIVLCTIERDWKLVEYSGPQHEKISFHPLYSKGLKPGVLNKIVDFVVFPQTLQALVKAHRIDFILSRGTPSGSLAWKVFRKTGIPFGVESFEPHADYMHESGVWKKNGLKYRAQKKWEDKQKQDAQFVITVSHNYREQLLAEGLPADKIHTIPCTVDTASFGFDTGKRLAIRDRLQIPESSVVGIYVGKFGDIYYDTDAFQLIRQAFDFFGPTFFMLILTPQSKVQIEDFITQQGLNPERFVIDCVLHQEIPHYLSASDVAFSFVKPAPSRKYCSPIKDGEYWANGLPILMGEDIGDDSRLIEAHPHAGFVFNAAFTNFQNGLSHIQHLLEPSRIEEMREQNMALAKRERGRQVISLVYDKVFGL